jgi:hypothetical protein
MDVINFSHPLTTEQLGQLEQLAGVKIREVIEVSSQFENTGEFAAQSRKLVDQIPWSSRDWQTRSFVVRLPSLDVISALVVAEIHGRAGYFPTIVRLRPAAGAVRVFEIAELIPLQTIRDAARELR